MLTAENRNDNGPITAADLAKALRHMGVNEDKWDWLAQEAAIMLEDQAAEITDLRKALAIERAARDHWHGLTPRADRVQFPFVPQLD
jgi:hypothetical protein